ncbi:MAG TPA: hypothetical protein VIS95_02855 [Solirubrobacterales bacterium]
MNVKRTIGLTVLTAAMLGLVGVGSALGAETTLCKSSAASPYCESKDRYAAETTIEAHATGTVAIKTSVGTIKCGASTLQAETGAVVGDPLPIDLSAWTLGGCGTNKTQSNCTILDEEVSSKGSLLWSKGADGALTLTDGGTAQWYINCNLLFDIDCTFSLEPQATAQGGNPAALSVPETALEGSAGPGGFCPEGAVLLPATYTVDLPKPAYVAKAVSSPDTQLCKAVETLCAQGNTYLKGTLIEAESANFAIQGEPWQLKPMTCESASMTVETEADSGYSPAYLPVELTEFALANCSQPGVGSCQVQTSIPTSEFGSGTIEWVASVDGWVDGLSVEWHVNCGSPVVFTYKAPNLTYGLKGGNPATFSLAGLELQGCESGWCPQSGKIVGADFTVASPKPLYVVK